MDPELEVKVKELKARLARGELTEDEFWDRVYVLERRYGSSGVDTSEMAESVGVGAYRVFMFMFPALVALVLIYFVFIYYPPPSDIDIRVESSSVIPVPRGEKEAVYRSLEFMKETSPERYGFVDTYVDTVEVAPPVGISFLGVIKGYYRTGLGKTIRMVHGPECPAHCDTEPWTGRDLLTAEFILHEACHSMQYHTNRSYSESQCYSMQFQFAGEVGPRTWPDFQERYFIWDRPSPLLS